MKVHTYCKINITLYDYMLTECRCGEYNIKTHFYNHNHLLLFISCSHWDESQVTFTYWITKLKLMMGSIMPHTELCTLEWLWESRRVKKEKKTHPQCTVASRLCWKRSREHWNSQGSVFVEESRIIRHQFCSKFLSLLVCTILQYTFNVLLYLSYNLLFPGCYCHGGLILSLSPSLAAQ